MFTLCDLTRIMVDGEPIAVQDASVIRHTVHTHVIDVVTRVTPAGELGSPEDWRPQWPRDGLCSRNYFMSILPLYHQASWIL